MIEGLWTTSSSQKRTDSEVQQNSNMLCLNDGFSLVLKNTVILLLLADTCRGQSEGVGSSQTVVTFIGEDVLLPCHLEPAQNAVSKSFEWGRTDLEPRFVHVWFEGQDLLDSQNPSYKGRTSVSIDNLKHGDLSLKLSAVKLSDNGKYRCLFPSQNKKSNVELVVGSVSSPLIAGININSSGLVLQCESEGWYPEPEVSWLDGEGHVLSAGPTETPRGPDGLYTVSSRVTVEERHRNSFTCRVQQKDINQTRETQIQISAEVIEAVSSSSAPVARLSIIIVAALILFLAAAFLVWKLLNQDRKTKAEERKRERERQQLLADWKKMEDLKKEKAKLGERLQVKEEEEKDLKETIQMLMEQRNELKKLTDQLEHQKDDMMKNLDDIQDKMKSVEKSQEYCDMKSVTLTARGHLTDRKKEADHLHHTTRTLLNKTNSLLNSVTDRKKEVEKQREKIREQLEEIQRKLQSEHKQET